MLEMSDSIYSCCAGPWTGCELSIIRTECNIVFPALDTYSVYGSTAINLALPSYQNLMTWRFSIARRIIASSVNIKYIPPLRQCFRHIWQKKFHLVFQIIIY